MSTTKKESKAVQRTRVQKERILAAAQSCFVESGFYAASMATIAETAGMSQGLIYRYFENKNAIILAIIEQQLTVARRRIRELHSSENLSSRMVEYFDEKECEEHNAMNQALYLEITAQAMRDSQIAEALHRYDTTVCSELGDWLHRSKQDGGYGLPESIATSRALMLLCLIEGIKLRGPRGPGLDRHMLGETLDELLDALVKQPA
ncbi:MAG: TetR/AcrR family transcriptional regulator [Lysobacterales bacterium]